MGEQLRSGYTTGTCASAAAMAAAVFVLQRIRGNVTAADCSGMTKGMPATVRVCLANGTKADFSPEYGKAWEGARECENWCRVKKDAGDDPDVTDGVWVYAGVFPVSEDAFLKLCREGAGYLLQEYPRLYLNGGLGIGIAQKEGLSCPVGHFAINPVPRRMILKAVESVCREMAYEGYLEIRVAVPKGVALAEKTFNPRLGIQGGISILGTTGIVEPMSEQALQETIRLDIRMKLRAGEEVLLLTPGNYGESFLEERLGVPVGEAVKCSNFIGDSVGFAVEEGFKKLLLVGHIGKLVKVVCGVKNTHSRYGDHRMEGMRLLAEAVTGGAAERIGNANTTEEAVGWLKEYKIADEAMFLAAEKVKWHLERWSGGKLEAEVVVFSSIHRVVGETKQARGFLRLWKGRV